MKRLIYPVIGYIAVMILLYALKNTIIPSCGTYDSYINMVVFLLHIIMIIITIITVRYSVKDVNIRYLVNSGFGVFYLIMMYICLKFEIYQVLCS